MRIKLALCLLGIPDSIVEQIPVQPVRPGVGMAARAALPVLKAGGCIVVEDLAAANRIAGDVGNGPEMHLPLFTIGADERKRIPEIQRRNRRPIRKRHPAGAIAG